MKKKFKLELHDDQLFLDGNEVSVRRCQVHPGDVLVTDRINLIVCPQVYVWIYDPVPFKTFAMGLILGEWLSGAQWLHPSVSGADVFAASSVFQSSR